MIPATTDAPERAPASSRSALITGASRGIGSAIAYRFAQAGWNLTITGRDPRTLHERVMQLQDAHGTAVQAHAAEATDTPALEALARAHSARFGRLDALVLNAGVGYSGAVADFPAERFSRLFDVNVRSSYVLIQLMLPLLRSTAERFEKAKVIAISSITGVHPEPRLAAYGATKAALISLCETLNTEESSRGVSATTISPGFVDTDMSAWTKGRIPGSEMIRPVDVATMALAIADLSRYAVVPNVVVTRPGEHLWRA